MSGLELLIYVIICVRNVLYLFVLIISILCTLICHSVKSLMLFTVGGCEKHFCKSSGIFILTPARWCYQSGVCFLGEITACFVIVLIRLVLFCHKFQCKQRLRQLLQAKLSLLGEFLFNLVYCRLTQTSGHLGSEDKTNQINILVKNLPAPSPDSAEV